MTNSKAAAETLAAMRAGGLLEDVDAAWVQAVEALAAAVDSEPDNASLWKQYREALGDLRGLMGGGDGDDFASVLEQFRGDAPVLDS